MNNSSVPMLDLARQYGPLRDEILDAISGVLDSRQFILGPAVAEFEKAAAAQLGVEHAVGCSSGTDALWLAIAACGLGPDHAGHFSVLAGKQSADAGEKRVSKIVTTPFSFFASVSSILRAGCVPVLADIDAATFNLSAKAVGELLETSAGEGVGAILPVHLYGQPADWDAFGRIAKERNLALIEDAAQAYGAKWQGADGTARPVGGLGNAAAFSFYPTKNLSAAGDAGMVTTNAPAIAERLKMLRQHGMRQRYHHDELGWNARMDGFQGAVLKVKLAHIERWTLGRARVAERYTQLFRGAGLAEAGPYPTKGVVLPVVDARARSVWHQYVIRTPRRDELRAFLNERQIGSEIYYPIPLHLLDALEPLGYAPGAFPEAERAAEEALALPIFPELTDDEQKTVVGAIAEFLS